MFPLMAVAQYTVDNKKAVKYYEVALDRMNARDGEGALKELNRALESESDFIEALLMRFQILDEARRYEEAEQSLISAIQLDPDFFPNAHFFFGRYRMRAGAYEVALGAFQKFYSYPRTNPNLQTEAQRQIRNCRFAMEAIEHPVPFNPVNMGPAVNSSWSEYFPSLTADDRNLLMTRRLKDEVTGVEQEDFYICVKNEGEWQQAMAMNRVNTVMNEGAPTFSPDGRYLIFTACEDQAGDYGPDRQGYGSCDLFYAVRVGDGWSAPQNLGTSINSKHWETQPSFSSDGRTLYFIRGVRSGYQIKQQDIYTSTLDDFGAWTKATRLDSVINTPFNESAVLIHPDGRTLYFTSDGHPGMGGEDIFMSRMQADGTWSTPLNLGYPINTQENENSITVSANGRLALFASDREGGYGGLDLYSFELPEGVRPDMVTFMDGLVVDKTDGRPLGAAFELIDLMTGKTIVSSESDAEDGTFLLSLPTGREYALNVDRKGYLFHSKHLDLTGVDSGEGYSTRIELSPIQEGETVALRNVFFPTDSYELSDRSKAELDKLVHFLNKNYRVRIEIAGHTDNEGATDYNKTLSQNRAESVVDYLEEAGIPSERLQSQGYGPSQPIASNDTEEGRALNRRTEFRILSVSGR
jgi:outer membrane protein OmpA-like peptidoglycan-associated protein